jgi:hypothetical protein
LIENTVIIFGPKRGEMTWWGLEKGEYEEFHIF